MPAGLPAAVAPRSECAQLRQQRFGGLGQEPVLAFVPHLNDRDISEARVEVLLDRSGDLVEVGAAGDRLCDVLGTYELARSLESGGRGEVGVDSPAAAEPAELLVRAGRGRGLVGVPADRNLTDLAGSGT